MPPLILFVDDQPAILRAVGRLFRPAPFRVLTCPSGADPLAVLARDLEARIVAVADVYDALTSHRPYRTAMPGEGVRHSARDDGGGTWTPASPQCSWNVWSAN